jgi:mono/diheme cytochrome c family protein
VLTYLGYKDTPAHADPSIWGPLPLAGQTFMRDERCQACHTAGGKAAVLEDIRISRDPEWIVAHARDPEVIAPGSREPPRGGMSEGQARSVLSYMRKRRAGVQPPKVPEQTRVMSLIIGRYCSNCHTIDGEGGSAAPDLSRVGAARDPQWLRMWITNPEEVDPFANMPAFGDTLTPKEMTALIQFLAQRK